MAEIKYLEINADDRSIIIPAGENLLGVENDNEGARKYFRCPKIVGDNIDLTKSDVYINVQNASGEKSGKDRYPVQNMTASGDNVTFEWVLERKVTSHKGSVRFAVCVGKRHGKRVAYHFCYWKCIGGRRTLRTGRTGSKRTGFYRDIDV